MDTNDGERRLERDTDVETTGSRSDLPPPYTEHVQAVQPRTIIRETIIIQPPLKDAPINYPCSRCHKRVITKVEYVNTNRTHMIAGCICGFTFWCLLCCLACIPYLIPTCKRVKHYCPECNTHLGDYTKV